MVAFEQASMAPAQVLPVVDGTAMAPSFGHIFSGGYAAGYYGYKWSEVLEADAFSLFKEKGIFNREVSMAFRDKVLRKGGTEQMCIRDSRWPGRPKRFTACWTRCGNLRSTAHAKS